MDSGIRRTWRRGRRAVAHRAIFAVEGLRYFGSHREFGWLVRFWRLRSRIHYFWVFEGQLFHVGILAEEFETGLDVVDLAERIFPESILVPTGDCTEADIRAVLAAVDKWEDAGEVAR